MLIYMYDRSDISEYREKKTKSRQVHVTNLKLGRQKLVICISDLILIVICNIESVVVVPLYMYIMYMYE